MNEDEKEQLDINGDGVVDEHDFIALGMAILRAVLARRKVLKALPEAISTMMVGSIMKILASCVYNWIFKKLANPSLKKPSLVWI